MGIISAKRKFKRKSYFPYSLERLLQHTFCKCCQKLKIFLVILRVFLTYGPGQNNNRFIPQIIHGCKNNSSFSTSEGIYKRFLLY